jgi:hypothetical protein
MTRGALEVAVVELMTQAEIRADWDWAAWWRRRWLALAQCPDGVVEGFARELGELVTAERERLCQ